MDAEQLEMPVSEKPRGVVLVVDDEQEIRETLRTILVEEGYQVLLASNGAEALEIVSKCAPSMVLLDIWMPGADGLEVLRNIKELEESLPVVMMSGHATIQTAVQATHMGAKDFIEKPFDLDVLLQLLQRHIAAQPLQETGKVAEEAPASPSVETEPRESEVLKEINSSLFDWGSLPGRVFAQKTLSDSVVLYGQGLHSGTKSGLVLEPLPENSGIHFVNVSSQEPVAAHVSCVESTGFATRLKSGGSQVATVEHLMSALHAYGITNLLVKVNDEVPSMDGSSKEFCQIFDRVGVEEQSSEIRSLRPSREIVYGEGSERISLIPAESFSVRYRLEYPEPVGVQEFEFALDSIDQYKEEIASARTFGFVKDIGFLQSQGLAQGGRFNNFVLFGQEGAINTTLRFENEPVRHKILDAIGDLYLLCRPLDVRVEAVMTGHSDNIEVLRKVSELLKAEAL